MQTRKVPITKIMVPETRVTAVYDEELQQLLKETMAKMGMITPVVLVKVGEDYHLVDGLHRLQEKIAAGESSVDAVVYEGEAKEALLMNLVLNKVRGKTKASEMVKVIGALYTEYGLDPDAIRDQTGLSRDYIEKLIQISRASPSVIDLLDQEIIGVGHAFEISRLPAVIQQDEICAKTQIWRYTVKELHELVNEVLRLMEGTLEEPPHREPLPPPEYRCDMCQGVLEPKYLRTVTVCPDCFGVAWRIAQEAKRGVKVVAATAEAPPGG